MIKDDLFNPYLVACVNVSIKNNPIPGISFKPRTVRWYELVFFTDSNEGYTLIDNKRIYNPAGSIMFRKPGTYMESISSFSCFNIAFDPLYTPSLEPEYNVGQFIEPSKAMVELLLDNNCPLLEGLPQVHITRNTPRFEALFKEAFQLYLEKPNNYSFKSKQIIYNILDLLLTEVNTASQPINSQIHNAMDYMKNHLSEPILLEDLASFSGYSREAFCRIYKAQFGISPIQYLIDLRIVRAKELLLTTDITLESIAEQTGFQSHVHFNATFKKRTGISPGQYRKKNQLQSNQGRFLN